VTDYIRGMRNILTIVILCYSLSMVSQKARETVLKNINEQQSAWNRGDIPGFMEHYWKSDSLKFIGSKGVTYGWKPVLENYLKSYPDKAAMGVLTFQIIEATPLGSDAVYVIGKWALQKEKPASGHFTLLWRFIGNKWVIVSDHTS
jgi:hypothetical protein